MVDSRKIEDLNPIVQVLANELVSRMKAAGYPVLITDTYRDSEYQNELYAKGRTTSGSIVTNAKGGYSAHNHRVAFDICKNIKGQEYNDDKFFDMAGKIGQEIGLEWGGSWTNIVDRPHFQLLFGYTCTDFAKGTTVPQTIKAGCADKRIVKFVQNLLGVTADGIFGAQTKVAASKINGSGEIDAAALKALLYKAPIVVGNDSITVLLKGNLTNIKADNNHGYFETTLSEASKIFPDCKFKVRDIMELAGCYNIMYDGSSRTITANKITVSNDDLIMLHKIVQAEAGGEDEKGKILVCNVIFNRVKAKGFPDSIKDVVFEPLQFQPITNGAYEKAIPSDATKAAISKAISGEDYSQNATYFCSIAEAEKPDNYHKMALSFLFQHGGHRFYS